MSISVLDKARTYFVLKQPFFGTLLLHLPFISTRGIPTMATDSKAIYYNPDFIESLDFDLVVSSIAHEIGHIAFGGFWRRGWREKVRWNIADDLQINLILKDSKFRIGKDWLLDEQYRGMAPETIYEKLPQPPPGDDGGCCGNHKQPQQGTEPGKDGNGNPIPHYNPEGNGSDQVEWERRVTQAYHAQKSQGMSTAGLDRVVESMIDRPVPWYQIFYQWFDQMCPDDYRWTVPNRRYVSSGLYLPSLGLPRMGHMVWGVDTSGSISARAIGQVEYHGNVIIQEVMPTQVTIHYCDAAIAKTEEYEQGEPIRLKPYGGGGTDFRPVFKEVEKLAEPPACLVYFTDLYGTFPQKKPDYPVLWVVTTDQKIPWGDVVRLKESDYQ